MLSNINTRLCSLYIYSKIEFLCIFYLFFVNGYIKTSSVRRIPINATGASFINFQFRFIFVGLRFMNKEIGKNSIVCRYRDVTFVDKGHLFDPPAPLPKSGTGGS